MSRQGQSAWLRKRAVGVEDAGFDMSTWADAGDEPETGVDIVPARPRGVSRVASPGPAPRPAAEMPEPTSGQGEPSWTDMLDPAALEARLLEARARRAEALARRAENAPLSEGAMRERATTELATTARATPARPRGPGATIVRPAHATPRPILAPARASEPVPPPLVADARPVPTPKPRPFWGDRRASLGVIFLVGMLGGGIAVWLLPANLGRESAEAPRAADAVAPTPLAVSLAAPTTMDEGPAALAPEAVAALSGPGDSAGAFEPRAGEPRAGEPDALPPPLIEAAPSRPVAPAVAPEFGGAAPVELAGPALEDREALPNFPRFAALAGQAPAVLGVPDIETGLPDVATRLAAMPVPVAPARASAVETARVFLHFPPAADDAAEAAVAALRAAGVSEATLVPGRVAVGSSNVRYFHEADREAAVAVAKLVAPSGGAAPETRDFTSFRPQPDAGLLEVWFAGAPPTGPSVAAARVATGEARGKSAPAAVATRAQPTATSRTTRQREAEAQAVQRILLERAVERMLKDRLPRG